MAKRDLKKMLAPYKVTRPGKFRLKDVDPADTAGLKADKAEARQILQTGIAELDELQQKLYAQDRWSVLLIFQAMDAAGKDGTIRHVMSGVNPQGCQVHSFKGPSAEELDHDYLWRCLKALPERGRIGIFNRSYYEETLVARVHPEILRAQHMPPELLSKKVWQERFEDINSVERYLARNGTLILKFFLYVSADEQKRRFMERLDTPEKHWKFSASDIRERSYWDQYMKAYEDTIRNTSTEFAPWYVIPADNKWFTRLAVAAAIIDAMRDMKLEYPRVSKAQLEQLAEARSQLLAEKR
ncbi:polyphosphate kinase 2 family protein [Uliginosibacterium sp. sgz301328]|uniref:polyphosphate kinase 2 family protein n=1 Tax=Uliginosibacterium sp. sgz301328 TaxID=3243764 RepID=UPI00359F0FE4